MALETDHTHSRENRSNARPDEGPGPEELIQKRKDKRSKSIQDYHDSLRNEIREKGLTENRSVSFNGISVMVDAALEIFRGLSRDEFELGKAVEEADIDLIKQMINKGSVTLECSLATSIEQDSDVVLEQLIGEVGDVNIKMKLTGLTMLHLASQAGSVNCASLLLHHGGDPNSLDSTGFTTPLHSVATSTKNSVDLCKVIVVRGGNINSGQGRDGKSVLHAAVRANNYQMVKYLLDSKARTDSAEEFHETPLHTAAENNCFEIIKMLLERGQDSINSPKSQKGNETALLIAAEAGFEDICQELLSHGADIRKVNGQCMTPLHLAARGLHSPVIQLLLEQSSSKNTKLVNMVDNQGRTALFVCTASKGRGATECMDILLRFGADPDIQNQEGFTALHVAAIDRKPSRLNLLISHDADLACQNFAGFSALHFINRKIPQCINTFEDRLDSGLKLENEEMSAKVKIDFNKLSPNINSLHQPDITIFTELLNSQFHLLLKHPLSQAFLYLKWNQIKYLHLFFVIFSHFIYSTVYTLYALLIFGTVCQPNFNNNEDRYKLGKYTLCDLKQNSLEIYIARIAWVLLVVFTLFYLVNETIKVLTIARRYFRKWDSYIDMALIISFPLISVHSNPFSEEIVVARWQFHAAAIGCFLSWLQMMFFIGKLPRFGKYVQMFRVVATSVLHLIIAYSPLLIAFAVAFMILFPTNEAFSHFNYALVKLFVMMLGEIEYEDLYYPQKQSVKNWTEIVSESEGQAFPGTAHFLVLLFIFLASIILMNLLVGLAVSDIQALSKSAKLNQLIQQVELINYMESWLSSPLYRWAPLRIQKYLMAKLNGLQGQNYNMVYSVKPLDINDKLFPEVLKRSLHENCLRRQAQLAESSRQAAQEEMQSSIQQIFALLGEKISKPGAASHNRLARTSKIGRLWQVEDDYESDSDITHSRVLEFRRTQSDNTDSEL